MQLLKPAPSRLHSNFRFAAKVTLSEPVKLNEAEVLLTVPEGPEPESMVVFGGVVSVPPVVVDTVQVRVAGVGSTLPAASMALTWKVWEPSERGGSV